MLPILYVFLILIRTRNSSIYTDFCNHLDHGSTVLELSSLSSFTVELLYFSPLEVPRLRVSLLVSCAALILTATIYADSTSKLAI